MGEQTCLLCIHWCVCRNYVEKGRESLKINGLSGLDNFFHLMAESCDNWQVDANIKIEREATRRLREIYEASEQGKVVVLQKSRTGSIDFFGIFDNANDAQIATHKDKEDGCHSVFLGNIDGKE